MVSLYLAPSVLPSERPDMPPMSEGGDDMRLMVGAIETLAGPVPIERIEKFFFAIDDVPYDVRRIEKDGEQIIQITATLGFIPFTAESVEKRQALMDIIAGAHPLFYVKFKVDQQQKMVITGSFSANTMVTPDFLFYPLTVFLQEALPFIKLIGRYL